MDGTTTPIRRGRISMTIVIILFAVLVVGTAGGAVYRTAIVHAGHITGTADGRIQGTRR